MPALSWFFFSYFAFIGALNPYFALWLQAQGYSAGDIGLLLAIPPIMRVFGPTSWGRLADRTGKRVRWLRLMAHASAIGLVVLALAPWAGWAKFWVAGLGLVLLHAMLSGQVPLTESLLLQKIAPQVQLYGRVRLYGSIGFIVAVLALGPILDAVGIQYLLGLSAALLAAHIVGSWWLVDIKPAAVSEHKPVKTDLWALSRLPFVPAFLGASFLMVFGHMGLYIYLSLYLEAVGYSKTMIGLLWALSAVGEVGYFWWQARLKTSPVNGYTRSYWVAALRFGVMAAAAVPLGAPLWLLIPLQLLHTVTFGMHHAASMALVRQLFPASAGSTANALFNTITYGVAGSVGALACSALWHTFGADVLHAARAVFGLSALACLLGGLLAWRLRGAMRAAGLA